MMRTGFIFFALFWCFSASAQRQVNAVMDSIYVDSIRNFEIQLEGLSNNIINGTDKVERITSCFYFVQTLKEALKVPNSFDYEFSSLKTVSALRPDDNKFRIFTWNLLLDSGRYLYFGALQMNSNDSLVLFGLYDSSEYNRNITYGEFDNKHWMGALYYQIHHYVWKKKDYYLTFGWDGQDNKTNRKIIDVLWFDESNRPHFGDEIFNLEGDLVSRLIFDFSDNTSMLCRYDSDLDVIVYAHLVPLNPMLVGRYENYVPDGTYDMLKFEKGTWRRYELKFDPKHAGDLRRF